VGGVAGACSCKLVSGQELQRTVEAYVRESGLAIFGRLQNWRSHAQKSKVGLLRRCCAKSAKGMLIIAEKFIGSGGRSPGNSAASASPSKVSSAKVSPATVNYGR
jgi:hypothetical protein